MGASNLSAGILLRYEAWVEMRRIDNPGKSNPAYRAFGAQSRLTKGWYVD